MALLSSKVNFAGRILKWEKLHTSRTDPLKAGESSEAEAMARLERSPYWAWTAIDPESKLLVVIESGSRTLAMAHRVVHQVGQKLAASCVPVCLTGG
jgi:hypothetical protein